MVKEGSAWEEAAAWPWLPPPALSLLQLPVMDIATLSAKMGCRPLTAHNTNRVITGTAARAGLPPASPAVQALSPARSPSCRWMPCEGPSADPSCAFSPPVPRAMLEVVGFGKDCGRRARHTQTAGLTQATEPAHFCGRLHKAPLFDWR